jgi:hypothetical protein
MDIYEDGYWRYWRQHCSASNSLMHGMKAVLYNRGIPTIKCPENPPTVQVQPVDLAANKAVLAVSEADSEDRSYLRYNLAYGMASAAPENWHVLHSEDQLLGGGTSSVRSVTISLPPQATWDKLVFLVHDNMACAVATYTKPTGGGSGTGGGTTGGGSGAQGGGTQTDSTSLAAASSFATTGTTNIAGWEWLRSDGARATWVFHLSGAQLPSAGQRRMQLFFNGLITNASNGGTGYSAPLTFVLKTPDGTTTSVTVPTTKPYGPPNPAITTGVGYSVHGQSADITGVFVSKVLTAGQVTAELVWPSGVGNAYHVAVRADSLSLRVWAITSGGGPAGRQQYRYQ